MSLFGESPPSTPKASRQNAGTSSGLFGEASQTAATSSGLFGDSAAASEDESPWSMPTPKKTLRRNIVKSLLNDSEVPESYVDNFDILVAAGEARGNSVGLSTVKKISDSSGVSGSDRERILDLVLSSGGQAAGSLERSEFNVLLALIGLAQEGEEISLDGVDERRKKLPQPNLSYFKELKQQTQQAQETQRQAAAQTPKPQTPQKPTQSSQTQQQSTGFSGDMSSDPWSSVKNIPPSTASHTIIPTSEDDFDSASKAVNGVARTTSTFTTDEQNSNSTQISGSLGGSNAWGGSYNSTTNNMNSNSFAAAADEGGFGSANDSSSAPLLGGSQPVVVPRGTGELVTVTILPDKEGMFLFQHHNYEVKAIRRGSSVVRRYSDFVWLLDCLQKRYPFRRLPLLPPKRVQVNGSHLAADGAIFLEKRRKGLVRFMNSLVQHPVLEKETLVVMFLTVPTEISVWRKQATISVQEEFVGRALPPTLESSLPATLPQLFDQVRLGVKRAADTYIGLCILLERMARRQEAIASDHEKFSLTLQSLTENHADIYAIDTSDVPGLNNGIAATSRACTNHQSILESECHSFDLGVVEAMKSLRDAMVSMKDVFDRRDRLARDNIPTLEKRISNNEAKLIGLRQKAAGGAPVKPGELEKVETAITSDKESIVQQHARGVFIRECVRDEIATFQSTIWEIGRALQDWAGERSKFASMGLDCWKRLSEELEGMPTGES